MFLSHTVHIYSHASVVNMDTCIVVPPIENPTEKADNKAATTCIHMTTARAAFRLPKRSPKAPPSNCPATMPASKADEQMAVLAVETPWGCKNCKMCSAKLMLTTL